MQYWIKGKDNTVSENVWLGIPFFRNTNLEYFLYLKIKLERLFDCNIIDSSGVLDLLYTFFFLLCDMRSRLL